MLKASSYEEPPFKVEYTLKVPKALESRVNRAYLTFIEDCMEELKEVKELKLGEYVGSYGKNMRNGHGIMKFENGDLYKGQFKNDVRCGHGICMFYSGALYKGDFKDDKPHGNGILYSGRNEIVESRFEKGYVTNGRIKIMLQEGSYYEGQYSNHRRHGQGICYYPNGEFFEGTWSNDKRVGRGKMKFLSKDGHNGGKYNGQFIND